MYEEKVCEWRMQFKFYRYQTIVKEQGHIWKLYGKEDSKKRFTV